MLTTLFFVIRSKYFERSDWLKPVARTGQSKKTFKGSLNRNGKSSGKLSAWDMWMEKHPQYQSIGNIWDKCDHDVTAGKVDFSVHFKGTLLHDKEYDFCEECEDLEEPLECPFKKGRELNLDTAVKLPSYIPKGHYVIFSRIKDQDGKEIGCINAEMLTGK
eukprot:gene18993-20904_t